MYADRARIALFLSSSLPGCQIRLCFLLWLYGPGGFRPLRYIWVTATRYLEMCFTVNPVPW